MNNDQLSIKTAKPFPLLRGEAILREARTLRIAGVCSLQPPNKLPTSIFYILTTIFCLLALPNTAQTDCKQNIQNIYQNITDHKPETGKSYHLNYTVKTTLWDSIQTPAMESAIDVIMAADRTIITSREVSVYQDETDAVTVMPAKKLIYIADAVSGKTRQGFGGNVAMIRDSLFEKAAKAKCTDTDTKWGRIKKIQLHFDKETQNSMGIKTILFYADLESETLIKTEIHYLQSASPQIKRVAYTFNEINREYSSAKTDKKATEHIMDKNGKLLPKYQGYRLSDVRNKKQAQ